MRKFVVATAVAAVYAPNMGAATSVFVKELCQAIPYFRKHCGWPGIACKGLESF